MPASRSSTTSRRPAAPAATASPAECVLLYSAADPVRWRALLDRETEDGREVDPEWAAASRSLLDHMRRFCAPGRCRHRELSAYFGQEYEKESCAACDTCLGESDELEEGTETAQKILSCVARVEQRFGSGHVVDVLRGARTERILSLGHDRLSTHGLLAELPRPSVVGLVFQLIDQGILDRTTGEYPLLRLNARSWEVLRGEREVLLQPVKRRRRKVTRTAIEQESWEGVDRDLFERLRELRRKRAEERGVPAYVIFGDATLREMARSRPSTPDELLAVKGVGEKKLADHGEAFLAAIGDASP
jgi:ATP-dependent DNA helicase RecQ